MNYYNASEKVIRRYSEILKDYADALDPCSLFSSAIFEGEQHDGRRKNTNFAYDRDRAAGSFGFMVASEYIKKLNELRDILRFLDDFNRFKSQQT